MSQGQERNQVMKGAGSGRSAVVGGPAFGATTRGKSLGAAGVMNGAAGLDGRTSFDDFVGHGRNPVKASTPIMQGEKPFPRKVTKGKSKRTVAFAPLPGSSSSIQPSHMSHGISRASSFERSPAQLPTMGYQGHHSLYHDDSDENASLDHAAYDDFTLTKRRMSLARFYHSGGIWGDACDSDNDSSYSYEEFEVNGSYHDSGADAYSDDSLMDRRMKAIRKCM